MSGDDKLLSLFQKTMDANGMVVGFFTTDWEKTRFAFPCPKKTNMYILHEHDDTTMKMCSKGIVFLNEVETQEEFMNSARGHSVLCMEFKTTHCFRNALFQMNLLNEPFSS